MTFLTTKELAMVELGDVLHPIEPDVEPGIFCRNGIHRKISMAEYLFWAERGILPEGCDIHKAPEKMIK